ncbi:hypothetical protein AYL99_01833 [Fonsecaea erecta]|uniref:Uncharacterized protein n=1 Tax=Fonsecaea erecta TaxID=1367422 RepID=A0A178ZT51_9EURO|nr:hypothetical protein AYL99_01833 [Fonsecaea erecta]OAP62606.1 hypothetical protein AYL99_01833 [Fonsecaea erecta]
MAEPVSDTNGVTSGYCNGTDPLVRQSRGEEGNHVNYHEDYGRQQTDYTLAADGRQRYDQSYGTSLSSDPGNQLQYSDLAHREFSPDPSSRVACSRPSSTRPVRYPSHSWQPVSHVSMTIPKEPLISPSQPAVYDLERPIQPPLSHKPCRDLLQSSQCQMHAREEWRGEFSQEYHVDSEDDLQALEFPDDVNAEAVNHFSWVQRKIQAFGATMDENDWMESQQSVIVSKYFRNTKDAIYFKPVSETGHWNFVKDDPAFADIASHGDVVVFEELYRRQNAMVLSYGNAENDRHGSIPSTADAQHVYHNVPLQQAAETSLSIEQEERLAALGVTGDPKPVQPRASKKRGRQTRSRSPESTGQQKQCESYRQRRYDQASGAVRSQDWREVQDSRAREPESLGPVMGRGRRRNVEMKIPRGQEPQSGRRGCKTKEKNKQQYSGKLSRRTRKRQHQRMSQLQSPNASTAESSHRTSQMAVDHLKKRKESCAQAAKFQ